MKTIICLLFSLGILVAADDDCYERWARANQKYYKCADEYSDDFTYWLMKYLDYGEFNSTSSDDVAVKSSAICAKFSLHVQCVEIRLSTLGENCLSDFDINKQVIAFKRNLLNYFCDEEAEKLQKALADNSYSSIFSGNFNICMADVEEAQLFNDINGKIILNRDYLCQSLRGVFACLKSGIETAQNKNLKTILQDLFTIIYDMLECTTN